MAAGADRAVRRRGRPRDEDLAERERDLLDSALDLFLRQGYRRTTIAQIMSAAHVSKRTLYQRYADKAALFRAALEHAMADLAVPRSVLEALESDDLEDSLQRMAEILVENLITPTGIRLLTITNSAAYSVPEIAAYAYHKGSEETRAYLVDFLGRHSTARGESGKDLDRAARAYQTLVIGGLARMRAWGIDYDEDTIRRLTRARVSLFVRGLLAPPRNA